MCQRNKCKKCKIKKKWLRKYLESLGVDLDKWKDLPATFREMKEDSIDTKSKTDWSFPINVAVETVFLDLIDKFNDLLIGAKIHVCDGYWQDTTYSLLFENGSKVSHNF